MICTGKGQYFTEKKRILCQHQVCEGKQGKFSCWFGAGGWELKDGISGLSEMGPPYLFNVFCWFLFFFQLVWFLISFFPSGWDAFPPIFEQNFELNGVTESRNGLGWDLRTSQFHPLLPWAGTKYSPGIFYSNLTFPRQRVMVEEELQEETSKKKRNIPKLPEGKTPQFKLLNTLNAQKFYFNFISDSPVPSWGGHILFKALAGIWDNTVGLHMQIAHEKRTLIIKIQV